MRRAIERFVVERAHPSRLGGVQRLYDLGNGYGVSMVNAPMLHLYPFAWEVAILEGFDADTKSWTDLSYTTPLTTDVEVFKTDEEADAFLEKAFAWAKANPLTEEQNT